MFAEKIKELDIKCRRLLYNHIGRYYCKCCKKSYKNVQPALYHVLSNHVYRNYTHCQVCKEEIENPNYTTRDKKVGMKIYESICWKCYDELFDDQSNKVEKAIKQVKKERKEKILELRKEAEMTGRKACVNLSYDLTLRILDLIDLDNFDFNIEKIRKAVAYILKRSRKVNEFMKPSVSCMVSAYISHHTISKTNISRLFGVNSSVLLSWIRKLHLSENDFKFFD